jgi:myo-inositol-1(or 4)-monophosphatase
MQTQWEAEARLATQAAREGGRIAMGSAAALDIQVKESPRDIVTAIDLEVDRAIAKILAESPYPVLSEERAAGSAFVLQDETATWIVDPIDGTANFAHGMEYYGVCVGLCHGLDFLAGAVYLPQLDQMYSAVPGVAQINGTPARHQHRALNASLVGIGFSNAVQDPAHRSRQYEVFGRVNESTRGCLRLGSTAVNICFTAANRLQCAYGLRAKIWDVAGALAVAIAAGCKVMLAPCGDQFSVDYVVGSRDVVDAVHALCVERELMSADCLVWEDGARR